MPWHRQFLCNSAALQHVCVPSHIMQYEALAPKVSDYNTSDLVPCSAYVAPRGGVLVFVGALLPYELPLLTNPSLKQPALDILIIEK